MRNPYTTGGWVTGQEFYGREALIKHLLESPNNAFWVIGNRRVGKTSLLRQLEHLTVDGKPYLPLYWDLQGIANLDDLAHELVFAVEESKERFDKLAIDISLLANWDVIGVIRMLRRYARAADTTLLLLIDEAEALLTIAEQDPLSLARLRKVIQAAQGLRVIMASTKVLSRLSDSDDIWQTSPFLLGFSLANLSGLQPEPAEALIRREQDEQTVEVSNRLVRQISRTTNNHPYLTQVLCSRLFEPEGRLRPITDQDLALDTVLQGYLNNDFRWLSPTERQTVLAVAQGHHTTEAVAAQTGHSQAVVEEFIFSLERLGQIRMISNEAHIGNEFLARWLKQNVEDLKMGLEASEVTDRVTLEMIRAAQEQETRYLLRQLISRREDLARLELQRSRYGLNPPSELVDDLRHVKMEIKRLERRLSLIPPDLIESYDNEFQRLRMSGAENNPQDR
ncbi:MAG: AAA family ATPase [Chloroflexota bacterium]|nr:AAA family ATPase [Chloroflexota bacterium]